METLIIFNKHDNQEQMRSYLSSHLLYWIFMKSHILLSRRCKIHDQEFIIIWIVSFGFGHACHLNPCGFNIILYRVLYRILSQFIVDKMSGRWLFSYFTLWDNSFGNRIWSGFKKSESRVYNYNVSTDQTCNRLIKLLQ